MRVLAATLILSVGPGCATSLFPPARSAVSVELLQGLRTAPLFRGPSVHALAEAGEVGSCALLRRRILPMLQDRVARGTDVAMPTVWSFGPAEVPEGACAIAGATSGGHVAARSLGEALAALESRDELPSGSHLILVGSVSAAEEARFCEAAARLTARGAWVELDGLGRESRGRCVETLHPAADAPEALRHAADPPVSFRILPVGAPSSAVEVRGRAGGKAVLAAPGRVRIRIDVEPPVTIGPLDLRRAEHVRIRLLDFPISAPEERSWTIERRALDEQDRYDSRGVPHHGATVPAIDANEPSDENAVAVSRAADGAPSDRIATRGSEAS